MQRTSPASRQPVSLVRGTTAAYRDCIGSRCARGPSCAGGWLLLFLFRWRQGRCRGCVTTAFLVEPHKFELEFLCHAKTTARRRSKAGDATCGRSRNSLTVLYKFRPPRGTPRCFMLSSPHLSDDADHWLTDDYFLIYLTKSFSHYLFLAVKPRTNQPLFPSVSEYTRLWP